VYQVLVDVYEYNLPLAQAQAQGRFHHQLLPDNVIEYEADKTPQAVITDLAARGWIPRAGLEHFVIHKFGLLTSRSAKGIDGPL
jgi:gamma-glutamyltranspeptidase/glutathione hydrolase